MTDCLLFTYLQSISSVTILRAGNGVHLLTRHDKEEGSQTLPRARRHRRCRATSSLFWSTLIKIKAGCRGALWKKKKERKKGGETSGLAPLWVVGCIRGRTAAA